MNIGIFGGTFDPPHLGHMEAARAAVEALNLDRLIFVPVSVPPHKDLPENGATSRQRLDMIRLMADGMRMPDVVKVSKIEVQRGGKSYTSDTLRQFREKYPEDTLWLLMGSDMFLTVNTWRRPEEIMALANLGAFDRTQQEPGTAMAEQAEFLRRTYNATVQLIPVEQMIEVSSTEIRSQGTGDGLWCQVWGYILRNQLYGIRRPLTDLDLPDLRAVSYSMVKAKRIPHIRGTEEEAVRLVQRWGGDPTQARRAAILHDCTKYLEREEHLKLCQLFQVSLDRIELENEKLLHAKTGAILAEHLFRESTPVVEAILWHTTGKANMTLLEKILYIADYMEPNREFPGVEQLRKLAYEDLDAAVMLGAEMCIDEANQKGQEIHPHTTEALDYLRTQKETDGF